jgi:hypothetical protein
VMFYTFNQNNSGGEFLIDNRVSHIVIIEADSAEQANDRAMLWAGIYFNGCLKGIDCDCCGDRWGEIFPGEGNESPTIYGKPAAQYDDMWADYFVVYYEKDNGKPTKVLYRKG